MPRFLKTFLQSFITMTLSATVLAQQGEILPGDNLIVDGIPKIPSTLLMPVTNYGNTNAYSLLGWDPVKPEVVVLQKSPRLWEIARISAAGESSVAFTFVPSGGYDTYYQPQGKSLVFTVDHTSGTELNQLYYYDIATKKRRLLTDGKSRNRYPIWSNSGEWLMYSSSRRNGKDLDIYVVKPDDERSDRMVAQVDSEDWAAFDWSPDDRKVVVSDYRSTNESYLWILDVATGAKKLLTPSAKGERIFNGACAQFSKDGKGVYHLTDRDSEFQRLAYIDIVSGQYTFLTSEIKWDIEEFALSPDRNLMSFITNEEGISKLHLLNTTTGKEMQAPRLPAGIISGLRWHNNGNYLGFALTSTASPGDIYSLELKTGTIDQWTRRGAGAGQRNALSGAELIRWKSFDGRMIPGYLYRPATKFTGRRPVLIDIHGGFNLQYRPGFRDKENYFTSEMGIATIYPNIRGSGGYGKTYMKLDNGYGREDSYKDIVSLLDWIKAQPDLDAEKVIVRGASVGGNVALAVATICGERIRGAISWAGASNIATCLDGIDEWYKGGYREEYGDERDAEMRQYLEAIAPVRNVKKIKAPLLIIHGKLDARVPPSESEQMIAAAKSEGIQVWSLFVKNEGHGFGDPTTRSFVFMTEVVFIERYLNGSQVSR